MDLPSSDQTNAKDDNLTVILAQIQQYNDNVKDVLEGLHPQNNQDIKELMCPLVSLICDLRKTLCAKLSGTTETLKTMLHTLKGLQEKFKDLNITNDYINYLIMVNQILEDTERNLKRSEEHLENIDIQLKHFANEDHKTEAAVEIAHEESAELKVNTNQEEELATNVQRDESDNSIISQQNDNNDETNDPESMDQNIVTVTKKEGHLQHVNMICDQEINPQAMQREGNVNGQSDSKISINRTSHSADHLLDFGASTYEE
ncbi:uncharacterized protein LOC120991045 [Bufo bufo]|uniref:uncharacterized protein LOC120991045 n=1 Tax=Bufo bufo TaxID=8384 RepID=UPI001ABEC3C7|nr:uncharacterized protein LOC120991045 [Bufo bufo]